MGMGDAGFSINYTVGPSEKIEAGYFPSCFAAYWTQEDLFLLAACLCHLTAW